MNDILLLTVIKVCLKSVNDRLMVHSLVSKSMVLWGKLNAIQTLDLHIMKSCLVGVKSWGERLVERMGKLSMRGIVFLTLHLSVTERRERLRVKVIIFFPFIIKSTILPDKGGGHSLHFSFLSYLSSYQVNELSLFSFFSFPSINPFTSSSHQIHSTLYNQCSILFSCSKC